MIGNHENGHDEWWRFWNGMVLGVVWGLLLWAVLIVIGMMLLGWFIPS